MPAPAEPADEDLMRAYAAGDARAFEQLYDRHATRLWRYITRSVGEPATSEELAQDVWLRVARDAPGYTPRAAAAGRPPARFTTWLFTIAHHRIIDHLRATRPALSLSAPLGDELTLADTLAAPSGFGPLQRVQTREQAVQLLAALDALPAEQRHAFLLQAEGDLSVAEIAATTGVGLQTAKSRLRYARAALRRTLEQIA